MSRTKARSHSVRYVNKYVLDSVWLTTTHTSDRMRRILLCFYVIISIAVPLHTLNASVADSLKNLLQTAKDTNRIPLLLKLSWTYRKNNTLASVRYAKEALELSERYNKEADFVASAKAIGIVYRNIQDYDRALHIFRHIESMGEKTQNSADFGFIKLNIGEVMMYQQKYSESLEYILESRLIFERLRDTVGLGYVALRQGELFQLLENYRSAEKSYNNCILFRQLPSIRDTVGIATGYVSLARLFAQENQLMKALLYIDSAIVLAELDNKVLEKINVYLDKAKILNTLQKTTEAREYFLRALERAQVFGNQQDITDVLQYLHRVYAQIGDVHRAYQYSLQYAEALQKLSEQEALIHSENTGLEVEWEQIKSAKALEQSQSRQQILIYCAVIFIIVLLNIGIIILIRNSRRQSQTIRSLETYRAEIEALRATEHDELWLKKGLSEALKLIQASTSLSQVATEVSKFLAQYCDRASVLIYTCTNLDDATNFAQVHDNQAYTDHKTIRREDIFEFVGGYAVPFESFQRSFSLQEGLLGEAAFSQKVMECDLREQLDILQQQPFTLFSAIGETQLSYFSVFPGVYKLKTFVVVECVGHKPMNELQKTLTRKISDNIALFVWANQEKSQKKTGL